MTRSWTNPAVLYGLFWFSMTFLPLVALIDVPIYPGGVAFIALTVIAFSVPALLMARLWPASVALSQARRDSSSLSGSRSLAVAFIVMQALTLCFVVINLQLQGFTIAEFAANPIAAANRYLMARYDGLVSPNIFSQASVVLNYIAVAVGGILIVRVRGLVAQAAILVAAFLPSLVYMQVYADKGTLFLAAAYFFGALVASRVAAGDLRLMTRGTLISIFTCLVILVPALVLTMAARNGSPNGPTDAIGKIMFYLRSYAFGHIYAFSDWFNHYLVGSSVMEYTDPAGNTWGYWSVMAVGEILWPEYELPDGYFTEYFFVSGVIQTNVYTMFRGAIYDFGVSGILIVMSLIGWAGAASYQRMLATRHPVISQSFFIFLIGFLYTSFIFSLLTWTSIYAAAIGVTVVLFADRALSEGNS